MKEFYDWKIKIYNSIHEQAPTTGDDQKFQEKNYILSHLEKTYIPTISSEKEWTQFEKLVNKPLFKKSLLKNLKGKKLIKKVSHKIELTARISENQNFGSLKKNIFTLQLTFLKKKNADLFSRHLGGENIPFSSSQQGELQKYSDHRTEKFWEILSKSSEIKTVENESKNLILTSDIGYITLFKRNSALEMPLPTKEVLQAFQQLFLGCLPLEEKETSGSSALFWLSLNKKYWERLQAKSVTFYANNCQVKRPLSLDNLMKFWIFPKPIVTLVHEYYGKGHDCEDPNEKCQPYK